MKFAVLGPVEVTLDDGQQVTLGSTREGTLLAILLVHAGQVVSTSRLIDGLWPNGPPAGAAATLPTYVKNLRRLLGDPTRIVTRRPGYLLRVEPGELDASNYDELVAAGRFPDALRLWRGRPFGELADEPFAVAWVTLLEERHLDTQCEHIDQLLRQGRHGQAVPEIEVVLDAHPFHERLWAQLMLGLYRSGRQAEALRAYGRARSTLAEELGIDPGPELRQLEQDILAQSPKLSYLPSADEGSVGRATIEVSAVRDVPRATPPVLATATRHQVALVGRDADLAWLDVLWRRAVSGQPQVAVVDGPIGAGRHRLVAEFARRVHATGATVETDVPDVVTGPTLVVTPVEQLPDLDRMSGPVLALAAGHLDTCTAAVGRRVLRPLDHAAVERLLNGVLGESPDAALVTAIVDESSGLPGRVVELAKGLAERELADRVERAIARAEVARGSLASELDEIETGVRRATWERSARLTGSATVVCPYKGLARFEREDAELFCGRDALVAALVARLVTGRFVAVVGASGSGKSSLVRAGLVPALAEGAIPGSASWSTAVVTPSSAATSLPAVDLLVIDQFEELFTSPTLGGERADDLIDRLVEYEGRVVVTLRSDYYGRFAGWPALAGPLADGQVLVGAMTDHELRSAVEEPAHRVGLTVEPALTESLIADVGGAAGALPLMSTAMLETWVRREGDVLTRAGYLAAGGVRGAIAGLAERVYAGFDDAQRAACRRVFLRLAEPGGGLADVRRRAPLAELGSDADDVLRALVAGRLVTVDADACEVAHEALLREWPRLATWLDEDRVGRRQHRAVADAAAVWDDGGRDDGDLYRGARLGGALDWRATHACDLNPTEQAFLDAGQAAAERELRHAHRRTRRLQSLVAALAIVLVGAVVAGAIAVDQRRVADRRNAVAVAAQAEVEQQADAARAAEADAEQQAAVAETARAEADRGAAAAEAARAEAEGQARTSRARSVAGQAIAMLGIDLDRALELAIEGYRTEDLLETRGALLSTLAAASGVRRSVRFGDDVVATGLDHSGTRAAVVHRDRTVEIWDLTRDEPVGSTFTLSSAGASTIEFDAAGDRVAIGYASGDVEVWDASTRERLVDPLSGPGGPINELLFTADGDHLVGLDRRELSATWWDLATGDSEDLGNVRAVTALAGDDRFLTGSDTGLNFERDLLKWWDGATGTEIGEPLAAAADVFDLSSTSLSNASFPWPILDVAVSDDGGTLATTHMGGFTLLRDPDTGAVRDPQKGVPALSPLALSPDGTRLAGVAPDGTARIWRTDLPTQAPVVFPGRLGIVDDLAFAPDGSVAVVGPAGARVLDPEGALQIGTEFRVFDDLVIDALAYLPDGRLAAGGTDEWKSGGIAVWDPSLDEPAAEATTSGVDDVAVSADGHWLAIAQPILAFDSRPTIEVRDLRTGDVRWLETPGYGALDMAFSPDGTLLAALGHDGPWDHAAVWWFSVPGFELRGATPSLREPGFSNPPTGLSFSGDGAVLAVAPQRAPAVLIDVATGEITRTLQTEAPGAYAVALDHDGSHLYVESNLGALVIDLEHPATAPRVLPRRTGQVVGFALSPDELTLYGIGHDSGLVIWDLESNQRLGTPIRPGLGASAFVGGRSIALAPDGRHVAVGYDDGRVVVWEVDPEAWVQRACALISRPELCPQTVPVGATRPGHRPVGPIARAGRSSRGSARARRTNGSRTHCRSHDAIAARRFGSIDRGLRGALKRVHAAADPHLRSSAPPALPQRLTAPWSRTVDEVGDRSGTSQNDRRCRYEQQVGSGRCVRRVGWNAAGGERRFRVGRWRQRSFPLQQQWQARRRGLAVPRCDLGQPRRGDQPDCPLLRRRTPRRGCARTVGGVALQSHHAPARAMTTAIVGHVGEHVADEMLRPDHADHA